MSDKLELAEKEFKMEEICSMKKDLILWAKEEFSKGKECVNTHEMGQVIDMIKDLCEVEEKCWETSYYKAVVEAMHDQDDEDWHEYRRGYNPNPTYNHYGHDMGPHSNAMKMRDHMDRSMRDIDHDYERMEHDMTPRKWRAYDDYQSARKHYQTQKDMESKMMMDRKAEEHIDNMIETVKDIWNDADPAMRTKLKANIEPLMKMMA